MKLSLTLSLVVVQLIVAAFAGDAPSDATKKLTETEKDKVLLDRAVEVMAMEAVRPVVGNRSTLASRIDGSVPADMSDFPSCVMGKPLLIKERVHGEDQITLVDKFWFRLDDSLDGRFALRVVHAVFVDEKLVNLVGYLYGELARDREREVADGWYSQE